MKTVLQGSNILPSDRFSGLPAKGFLVAHARAGLVNSGLSRIYHSRGNSQIPPAPFPARHGLANPGISRYVSPSVRQGNFSDILYQSQKNNLQNCFTDGGPSRSARDFAGRSKQFAKLFYRRLAERLCRSFKTICKIVLHSFKTICKIVLHSFKTIYKIVLSTWPYIFRYLHMRNRR